MSNLRCVKKSDGSCVKQRMFCLCKSPECPFKDVWQDIPTIEEPKKTWLEKEWPQPKKELWEILHRYYLSSQFSSPISTEFWVGIDKIAREYIENERKEKSE